jgi:hypothetical protein
MKQISLTVMFLLMVVSPTYALVDYASIPANTWVRVYQGSSTNVNNGTEPPGMILSFGGGTIDPIGKKLLVFGGGHNDYYGNEVWIWNITTQTWTKKYTADSVNSSGNLSYCRSNTNASYPGMWTPNSRPISRHTANGLIYMTYNNKYYIGGSSLVSGSSEQWWQTSPNNCYPQDANGQVCCPGDVWWYDETANTWTWKTAGVNNETNVPRYSDNIAYNPATAHVIIATKNLSNNAVTWVYSPSSGTFTKKNYSGSVGLENEQAVTFDTNRGRMYIQGGDATPTNKIWAYTESTNTWIDLNPSGTPPTAGGANSMAYDSLNDRVLVLGRNGGKWYIPSTNSWASFTATGGPNITDDWHYYSRAWYDASNNLIFVIDRVESSLTVDIWAYRYSGGIPPRDTTYSITTSANTGGSISPSGSVSVDYGANKTFTITANSGYSISDVLVDGSSAGAVNSYTFTNVTANHTISATFIQQTQQQYTLTVTKAGTGTGSVTSAPAGISCGTDCSESYAANTAVTLSASPDASATFSGWSGACSGTSSCSVTMSAARSVAATFTLMNTPAGITLTPTESDEIATYNLWGWSFNNSQKPSQISEPTTPPYTIYDPDIHGDTEGDDLWSYLMMYNRSGNTVYLNRAIGWARYFKDDYNQCVGSSNRTLCYDYSTYGILCHIYGWGLVDYYYYTGNSAYLVAAKAIADRVYNYWSNYQGSGNWAPVGTSMAKYGARANARHLLLAIRVAAATGLSKYITLRDYLINMWINSGDWDSRGMYCDSEEETDGILGSGAWAAGARIQNAFNIGILAEALNRAYLVSGNATLKSRLIAMAGWANTYGMQNTYFLTGSSFGVVNGSKWHRGLDSSPPWGCDGNYSTALVNLFVMAYKFTGNTTYLTQAKYYFNRGTKGPQDVSGDSACRQRPAGDTVVEHFVDTRFDSSSGYEYLDHNKGELQYTYLLFENGGLPLVEDNITRPSPPTGVKIQ